MTGAVTPFFANELLILLRRVRELIGVPELCMRTSCLELSEFFSVVGPVGFLLLVTAVHSAVFWLPFAVAAA